MNRGSDKKKGHDRRWTLSGQDESPPHIHGRRKSNSQSSSVPQIEKLEGKPRSNKLYRSKAESEKMKKLQESLITWAKNMLKNDQKYSVQNINDFNDGIILLAILHNYDSSLIDIDNFDTSNPVNNFETLFNIVESKFGINNIFDPTLIVSGNNPSGLTLYISMMKTKMETKNDSIDNRNYISEVKDSLNQFSNIIQTSRDKIEIDNKEVESLYSNDKFYEIKNQLKERYNEKESQIEKCMNFIFQLDSQNKALREQNIILQQKINILEDINKHDKIRTESVQKRLSFMNRLLSLSSLLTDNDLETYLKSHEDELKKKLIINEKDTVDTK